MPANKILNDRKLRAEFWHVIGEVELENLVFIDEAGVNIAMSRLYARALKERAHGSRPDKRGKNVTIIGAMALRGIIGAMTFRGTDTQLFYFCQGTSYRPCGEEQLLSWIILVLIW